MQQYPPQQFPTQQFPSYEYPQPEYPPQPYAQRYPPQHNVDPYGGQIPPNRNRNLAIVASVAALVAVGVIAAVVVLVNKNGGQTNSASTASTTGAAASSTSAAASSTESGGTATTGPDVTATGPHPTIPGWTAVAVGSGAAADVPPDWSTGSGASVITQAAAVSGLGACTGMPTSFRAVVEPLAGSSSDPNVVLQTVLRNVGGYDKAGPQIAMAAPHPTADGTFQDYRAVVGLTPPTGQNCDPPQAIVHILIKTGSSGLITALFVEGDQQCNGAVDPATLDKIANSVRTFS
jgi:hypothetical protein